MTEISVFIVSEYPYKLRIRITGNLPKSANSFLGRGPWNHRKNSKDWKKAIRNAVRLFLPPKPLKLAQITVLRESPRLQDFDGMVSSLKPLIDGLTPERGKGGKDAVLKDDSWAVTGAWRIDQRKCKTGQQFLEITVEEV